jgi:hypothetical protein
MTRMNPDLDVSTVQRVSGVLIPILEAVSKLMQQMAEGLPPSPDEELERLRPYSLATDVRTSMECAVNDYLTPAIRILMGLRDQTEEGAARGWRPQDRGIDAP